MFCLQQIKKTNILFVFKNKGYFELKNKIKKVLKILCHI